MPCIRVVFLWHMHQPFYKDLVTGEYRLPWVRLHALKDYYGMVKLLKEFPRVQQTFNLVPSLITQIEDYVSGTARDPFLKIASTPAVELDPHQRRFALQYLFQANPANMIGRYPRYQQLWEQFCSYSERERVEKAEKYFPLQDFTDLQVLSQLAWYDEFFLEEPEIAALTQKGRDYSVEDQQFVINSQKRLLAKVLPAYRDAAHRGAIEISTSPFYHPILPLLCDSNQGRVSSPGLALPQERFVHPEDAREQLQRGLDLHERVFGLRPCGAWPSEGSVSEEALAIGASLGLTWMATDEGVLGRSLDNFFNRDGEGRLEPEGAEKLYQVYRYEKQDHAMNVLFRDHSLSDLIGFVYSGMSARDAAQHFIQNIHESAKNILAKGKDATISIILDGENAWEYYPGSGREFLRRLYDGLQADAQIETVTVSAAIERQREPAVLRKLVPGSWINANFNVWIGAPEDNRAWDYLAAARDFYEKNSEHASPAQSKLAFEEILIAEGSDWNWWYGPEHHSANDCEFDELYRKHLSNIYQALGAAPPAYLAHPILSAEEAREYSVPQTSYIHPIIDGDDSRYFDWIGAAMLMADGRDSAMHGKEFLIKCLYAGIDQQYLYGRIDFAALALQDKLQLEIALECQRNRELLVQQKFEITIADRRVAGWNVNGSAASDHAALHSGEHLPEIRLGKILEFKLPLAAIRAKAGDVLRIRISVRRGGLPTDALPGNGWLELPIVAEEQLQALAFEK